METKKGEKTAGMRKRKREQEWKRKSKPIHTFLPPLENVKKKREERRKNKHEKREEKE